MKKSISYEKKYSEEIMNDNLEDSFNNLESGFNLLKEPSSSYNNLTTPNFETPHDSINMHNFHQNQRKNSLQQFSHQHPQNNLHSENIYPPYASQILPQNLNRPPVDINHQQNLQNNNQFIHFCNKIFSRIFRCKEWKLGSLDAISSLHHPKSPKRCLKPSFFLL